MRKQTKLVAVLSAASLLAIGASMTSFAATKGWTEENGEWVYLDSDGERVTQEWKKSGSNYYWLDENGVMATNQIVDDDDNTYYVNEAGVRAKNQWISVENEDDVDVNGEEVDTLWYYFGDNGKAYKAENNDFKKKDVPDSTGTRTYFFDSDGHMVSDWVEYSGDTYYCGGENEGWAYTGWQYLEPSDDLGSDDYDDQEWFNFKSSGKMRKNTTWYSKGRYYTFDTNGVMADDWYSEDLSSATNAATPSNADAYTTEDGTKGTGWVLADTPDETDTKWYYLVSVSLDGGKNARNIPFNSIAGDNQMRAKVIKSKTYIFNPDGTMEDGRVVLADDTPFDTLGGAQSKSLAAGTYYFNENSGSTNGQMVTGKTTVVDDGETYNYYFEKSTGRAITNIVKDGVVYGADGDRVDADDGNSNMLYDVPEDIEYNKSKAVLYSYTDVNGKTVDVHGIPAGSTIIVSSTGKLRTSGTVKVDGIKWKVIAPTTADDIWTLEYIGE